MSLERHRSTLIIVTAISIPTLLLVQPITTGGSFTRYGYPLLALYLSWVLWSLFTRRHSLELLMKLSFWIISIFWLGMMAFRLYALPDLVEGVQRLSPNLYMVFIALSIMAHLVFGTRESLKASLGIVTGTILISLGWLVRKAEMGEYLPALVRLLSYEVVLGISILLLYALAKSKDDHTEALLEAQRMRGMAYTDPVTDLPNRRRLEEDLERYWALAIRHELPFSIIIFDIDRFKEVNDEYGHKSGDEILQVTGQLAKSQLRAADVFGRWGGEEFLIIAPETNRAQAIVLADRVREAIERHPFPAGISITASFGVATRTDESEMEDLLEQADQLLYRAKQAGRNRVAA